MAEWRKVLCGVIILLLMCFIPEIVLADNNKVDQECILVTGFEPFGGKKTNGSWEAVQHLQGRVISGRKVIVTQLPVVWERASVKLEALMRHYHPVAVIAFGEAGAEPLRVEMVARNVREMIPDNIGLLPKSSVILTGAPLDLRTTLNTELIIQRLHEAGIPVTLSQDAGGYLCNETFFNLMHMSGSAAARSGFIHLPPVKACVLMPDGSCFLFDKAALEKTADVVLHALVEGL
jgi:pyroglutamyl-peptidase